MKQCQNLDLKSKFDQTCKVDETTKSATIRQIIVCFCD